MKKTLCPFSKPIIGGWCECKQANLDERCAGKMTCLQADIYLDDCYQLVDLLKEKSRFVLGISQSHEELTHMQLMKIRCGGLKGLHRELVGQPSLPDVLDVLKLAEEKYGSITEFPFSNIISDIKKFSHRKKKQKQTST